jgi:hypothetical protein
MIGVTTSEAVGLPKLSPLLRLIGVAGSSGAGLPFFRPLLRLIGVGVGVRARPAAADGAVPHDRRRVGEAEGVPKLTPSLRVVGVASGEALGLVKLSQTVRMIGAASGDGIRHAEAVPAGASDRRDVGRGDRPSPSAACAAARRRRIRVAAGSPSLKLTFRLIGVVSGAAPGRPLLVVAVDPSSLHPGVPGGVFIADAAAFGLALSDTGRFAVNVADAGRFGLSLADVETFRAWIEDLERGR